MKFQIIVKNWLQGEGAHDSYLLRSQDSKMCCLGFYEEALGVPRDSLKNIGSPNRLHPQCPVPKGGEWLYMQPDIDDDGQEIFREVPRDVLQLMQLNDLRFHYLLENKDYTTWLFYKMRGISELFAKHNVEVEWIL